MFPNQDAVNRHVYWTDPVFEFFDGTDLEKARFLARRRIVGVTADIDDGHVVPEPTVTIYTPFEEGLMFGGRLFIHTGADPYALVPSVTRILRDMSADQPVEHAATLEDIRAEVLTPDRLNSLVFGVFAAVALAIAVVGVAGVLAFSVSARTREFGIRLALGSEPRRLLNGVIQEGALMAAAGLVAGAVFGFVLARLAGRYFLDVKMPGALPVLVSARRADGGRGHRVGSARGTRSARRCDAGVALRVIVGWGVVARRRTRSARAAFRAGGPKLPRSEMVMLALPTESSHESSSTRPWRFE